jgi:molecular chaperone HtpG
MSSKTKSDRKILNFDTNVCKILQLMAKSVYINKEVFLRELISNASDACDKLRYLSQTNQSLIADDTKFKITVKVEKENRKIEIGILNSRDPLTFIETNR